MPRPKLVREPCDCLDCVERPSRPPTTLQAAVARQEPPPKSLLIYIHEGITGGEAPSLADVAGPHVAALVRDGCNSLLAFTSPGNSMGAAVSDLLSPCEGTLEKRFKGLLAAAITDSPAAVAGPCSSAGVHSVLAASPAAKGGGSELPWPAPAEMATRITQRLGLPFLRLPDPTGGLPGLSALDAPMPDGAAAVQGAGNGVDEDDIDMLLLLLDARSLAAQQQQQHEAPHVARQHAAPLDWLDALLQQLNRAAGFRDTVLLSVVLGVQQEAAAAAGIAARLQGRQQGPLLGAPERAPEQQREGRGGAAPPPAPRWPFRQPLQSHQFRGTQRAEANPGLSAVVVHRLPGVIRRDAVGHLDLQEILLRGGGGCILAGRVLPEVAYKLGRAPKYGA